MTGDFPISPRRAKAIVIALALVAGLVGALAIPVLDRDEARYAQASSQMLETGDFLNIRFQGVDRNKKPAGIYWLQAAAVAVASDVDARRIWVHRIPSLIGAMLAALACWLAGIRLLGPRAAFAGSAMLGVGALFGFEAGLATTDAALCGAATLMMAALADIKFRGGGRLPALGFWAALAAGVLIKGPIAPLLGGLTIVTLALWERRIAWARPLAWWGGPVLFLAIAAPWFVLVETVGMGFVVKAVAVDLAPKLVSASEGHSGPPGYHSLVALVQLWPATLFLIPGLALAWGGARASRDSELAAPWRFLLAWALPFLLVLELTPTKLSHYGMPAYPAFALMAGGGFAAIAQGAAMRRTRLASAALFVLGAGVLSAALVALAWMYGGGLARGAAIATALIVMALTLAATLRQRRAAGLILAVAAALAWHVGGRGLVLPNLEPLNLARRIADVLPQTGGPTAMASYSEPSLVFLSRNRVRYFLPEDALDAARAGAFDSYAVPPDMIPDLESALAEAGLCGSELGRAAGWNYSNGRPIELVVLGDLRQCGAPDRAADGAAG